MGGISANKPIMHLVTGPMMPGSHRGVRIGACTDCRNNWAKYRAGAMDIEDISAINDELAPTVCILTRSPHASVDLHSSFATYILTD
jgi:dihydroxy-acid dehydratase